MPNYLEEHMKSWMPQVPMYIAVVEVVLQDES